MYRCTWKKIIFWLDLIFFNGDFKFYGNFLNIFFTFFGLKNILEILRISIEKYQIKVKKGVFVDPMPQNFLWQCHRSHRNFSYFFLKIKDFNVLFCFFQNKLYHFLIFLNLFLTVSNEEIDKFIIFFIKINEIILQCHWKMKFFKFLSVLV